MRYAGVALLTVALLAGCSGSSSSSADGGGGGPQLVDGVQLRLDRTQLLFGQDYGNAVLLGTQPVNTLQLISGGKQPLTISKVEIVAGQTPDGGPAADTGAFSFAGPDKTTLQGGDTALVQVTFNPTEARQYAAILRITSNDPSSPTDVLLSGDCVTPVVTVVSPANGSTDVTLPPVTLVARTDGGTDYATQVQTADILFTNTGTAALEFKDASMASDAGASPITLCTNNVQGANGQGTFCQPGPLPSALDRTYPDGGVAIRQLPDGGAEVETARVTVVFTAATPGNFTDHVIVPWQGPNDPSLTFTVHASASAQ